jgi:predicted metal-dependent TIM-barrel fold hydrolase
MSTIDVYNAEFCGEPESFDRSYLTVEELIGEIGLDRGTEEELRRAIETGGACELSQAFEGDPPVVIRYPGVHQRSAIISSMRQS